MAARPQKKTSKTAARSKKTEPAKRASTKRAPAARKSSAAARTRTSATPAKPAAKKPAGKSTKSSPAKKAAPATKSSSARAKVTAKPAKSDFTLGKLGQVALTAKDLRKSVIFYRDVLELKLQARFDDQGLAFFQLGGGARLLLSASASEASLYFATDDLDGSVKALKKRGVKFLQKPALVHRDEAGDFGKKGTEEWMAFFHDPSGNLLALVERR